jgi:hypothetical protein
LHADGFQCPATVSVPSLSAQPAAGNFQAQIELQAAYGVAREYYHQNGAFDGTPALSNSYLNSKNPALSAIPPANPAANNPPNADPSQIDIVKASGNDLQICNSGTGDTSYCISVSSASQVTYTTLTGTKVTATLPT